MLEERNNLLNFLLALRELNASKRIPEEFKLVLQSHECIRPVHVMKYNMSESSKGFAFIVGEKQEPLNILVHRKAQLTSNGEEKIDVISVCNRFRDPLYYPLRFFNESGEWHSKLYYEVASSGKMKKMITNFSHSRMTFEREGEFNIILRRGRLSSIFLCEAAYTTKAECLSLLRFNQSKLGVTNHN